MTKIVNTINTKNEKMKKSSEKYCTYSIGYSETSIKLYLKAICAYEEFTNFKCYSTFNYDTAIKFREFLINREKKRAWSTIYDYLRYLKVFFIWLSNQPGYKKPIKKEHIEALRLTREQTEMALAPQRERYPTLEIVQKLVHSMPAITELDLRDRALISFTLLSGMRDNAIITLPLKCFDVDNLEVFHDVKAGVKSKFGKTHQTYLFPFDEKMLQYVVDWYNYLIKEKLYSLDAPLFPKNKIEQEENSKSFVCKTFEPEFWKTTGSITEIFKQRFKDAGLEYYSPHTFRHLANRLSKKACKSIEEFQAISQNFGHKNMGTTYSGYGKLAAYEVQNVISGLDFSGKRDKINSEKLDKILEFIGG